MDNTAEDQFLEDNNPPKTTVHLSLDEAVRVYWKYKGLIKNLERSEAYWKSTNNTLEVAFDLGEQRRMAELEKTISELKKECEKNIKHAFELEMSNRELLSTQDQLIHAEKLNSIGNLAGGIAHDFNNLLTSILGYADLLSDELKGDSKVLKKLDVIIMSANRGADLTTKLLGFARKGALNFESLKVEKIIEDAVSLLTGTIFKTIKIKTKLSSDLWNIHGDSSQILQILMNLGLNANDAMPDGGDLVFEAENVVVDEANCANRLETKPGSYVRVAVRDSGQGISKEITSKMFDPFFTTKDVGKGTGLGLSMAYGIMMKHKGSIDFYSLAGEGTCFYLYFPANSGEDPPE